MKPWIIAVDLDGVLCKSTPQEKYSQAQPIKENINRVNKLHEKGHRIIIHTARGWFLYDLTAKWLISNGVEFDQLVMGKLYAHCYIDDLSFTFDEIDERLLETK